MEFRRQADHCLRLSPPDGSVPGPLTPVASRPNRGRRGRHLDILRPGFGRLVSEPAEESPSSGIEDFTIEAGFGLYGLARLFRRALGGTGHVLVREFFRRDQRILFDQGRAGPVQGLLALVGQLLVQPGQLAPRPLTVLAVRQGDRSEGLDAPVEAAGGGAALARCGRSPRSATATFGRPCAVTRRT